jgi:hypothetical protein
MYVAGNSKASFGLQVKWPIYLSDFKRILSFSTVFNKTLSIKFHINSFSQNRADACGHRADGHDEANRSVSQICYK